MKKINMRKINFLINYIKSKFIYTEKVIVLKKEVLNGVNFVPVAIIKHGNIFVFKRSKYNSCKECALLNNICMDAGSACLIASDNNIKRIWTKENFKEFWRNIL